MSITSACAYLLIRGTEEGAFPAAMQLFSLLTALEQAQILWPPAPPSMDHLLATSILTRQMPPSLYVLFIRMELDFPSQVPRIALALCEVSVVKLPCRGSSLASRCCLPRAI
jgi:hypothetical protein